jgi:hypothetical protein
MILSLILSPLFAADLKVYRNINYVHDCKLLQSDINSVPSWCLKMERLLMWLNYYHVIYAQNGWF